MTYKEAIIQALKQLNGHAYLKDIYSAVAEILEVHNQPLVRTWKAVIRATLEINSSDSTLHRGEDIFCSVDGIGTGHWGLRNFDKGEIELTQEDDEFSEGKVRLKQHLQRERNIKLIEAAKKRFIKKNGTLYCEICGFSFSDTYGELGKDFIEAHHTKPVSEMHEGETTKIEDVVMVCSNCHSMIHRKKPWLSTNQLKDILKNQ